jgi:hypothetical protein
MAKVFRLHTNGNNTIVDWQTSGVYGRNVIGQIDDPDGATARKEITSIPSPLARIDLVKTAFEKVTEIAASNNSLDGNTIFHKMVSDSLDVGEIFFNVNKLAEKVEILIWDKNRDLYELQNNPAHKALGDTLGMFFAQDAAAYNFNRLQRLYLLNYIGPDRPAPLNIIGATSPATLFFSSANNLNYVSRNIQFGQDRPFDDTYQPLCKRDFAFQKYLYTFRFSYPDFARDFPEMNKYLDINFGLLSNNEKNELTALDANSINTYQLIQIATGANYVEILNVPFHRKGTDIRFNSDFEIKSSLYSGNTKPLVLPVVTGNTYTHLIYTQDKWGPDDKAPFSDATPWQNRILPLDGSSYPFLTISDFLEDTIIRMPYKLNESSFFDGNMNKANENSYLLPLTDLFFDFFSIEQLMGEMPDGKKMFEMRNNAGGVTVILRIPVKRSYIEYHRIYFENSVPDVNKNEGALEKVDDKFGFALFPTIKFKNDKDAYYRFGIISDFQKNNYSAEYHSENGIEEAPLIIRNSNRSDCWKCKTYVLENSNFDYIRIRCPQNCSGLIIPIFYKQEGFDQYTFAIDFGTTNIHVEYSVNGQAPKPLDIAAADKQIHLSSYDLENIGKYVFDYDFIPELIGSDEEFKFPMRTALSEAKSMNWNLGVLPFAHANIAFPYEKRGGYAYNRISTGLKWSNDTDRMKKIQCYIESLFLILRNKVILNNGDLSRTKIVWFYPISMTRNRFNLFKLIWENSYLKYFGNNLQNVIAITESVAPYEYYKNSIGSASNMVSIDIGGGSSDIVIAEDGAVRYITSFRFAANSVFGDGYANNGDLNGIIRQFEENIHKVLKDAEMGDLLKIYTDLKEEKKSSDMASFFFSLNTNKKITEKRLSDNIDFNRILQADDTQKIIFIFFYVAIIYHLAHLMKAKKLPMPRHITFSGNGSKVIRILSTDNKLLEDFTRLIYEKIYGKTYNKDGLAILHNVENPKEATCKGGISSQQPQDYSQIFNTKVVLNSADNQSFITTETYAEIKEDYLVKTVEEVTKFIEFTIDLNKEFSYKNNFGISNESLEIAQEECFRDLETYAKKGLEQKLSDASPNDPIEETFFFYPLNGMINALSMAIYNNEQK